MKRLSKVDKNKKNKEMSLLNSAYELFTTKGVNNTTINDIVKKAGVAKGTFYLYFKDKYEILDEIVLNKSSDLIIKAYESVDNSNIEDFTEGVICFTDYIIEYFKENKIMLNVIHKNLSWGIYKEAMRRKCNSKIEEIYNEFVKGLKSTGVKIEDVDNILFIIIEMIGTTSYSSIILNEPTNIDEMKPILFNIIRKII